MSTTFHGLPPGLPHPSVWQTWRFVRDPLSYLGQLEARCGDIFTLRLVGNPPWVCLSRPDHLKAMYTGDADTVLAGRAAGFVFSPLTGWNASLTLDGSAHRERRRLVRPAFAHDRVPIYAALVQTLAEREVATWPTETPFSLHPSLKRITLEVILEAIFGVASSVDAARLGRLIDRLANQGMNSPLLFARAFQWNLGRYSPWGKVLRIVHEADTALRGEIRHRRTHPDASRMDVLSTLIRCRTEDGEELTEDDLRDELVALLIAGHETTHSALCWILERLMACPSVAERVEAELATAETHAEILRLPYLDAVIRESLRFRPISAICGGRRLEAPLEIGSYTLPAGIMVTNCTALLHRRADLYPNPERFDPERFLQRQEETYSWTVFGGGNRRCMGFHLAFLEIKIVLAVVLKHMRLRLEQANVRPVAHGVHLVPEEGLRVIAEKRA